MDKLQQLRRWYFALPVKEQRMIAAMVAVIIITIFYLSIWEPIHKGLAVERQKQQAQKEVLLWMQEAAIQVKTLRSSGSSTTIKGRKKPTTLVVETALNNAGLKSSVNKIESAGNNGARVSLKDAPFNQVLIWLNTLAKHNGIQVISASIDRGDQSGRADVRLTFERP